MVTAQTARLAVWACVLGGAGTGLLWGMVARIWMRLMAPHPEFTISGTAMILLFATQFGLFAGLAHAASALVVSEKPSLVAPLNVALYLGLVYPLVVGLRIGLEPGGR